MSTLNIFGLARAAGLPATEKLMSQLEVMKSSVNSAGGAFASREAVCASIGLEGYDSYRAQAGNSVQNLQTAVKNMRTAAGMPSLGVAQEAAAVAAAVLASAPAEAMKAPLSTPERLHAMFAGRPNYTISGHDGRVGTIRDRSEMMRDLAGVAMEYYDEKANSNAVAYSVTYNAEASRQDDFGEKHYPTVTTTQESIGFQMSIRLHLLQEEVRRKLSGDVSDWGRHNIIKALVKPGLLRNDQTLVVPVYRDDGTVNDTTKYFVPAADVPPYQVSVDRENVTTAPLKFGQTFDLLGLSQTEKLLAAGVMDQTDALDPSIRLQAIWVKLGPAGGNAVVKFKTEHLPLHEFNLTGQGNARQMTLNFSTSSLRVTADTKSVTGAAIAQLSVLNKMTVRLSASAFGNILLNKAEGSINSGEVTVKSVTDETRTVLGMDAGVGKTVADIFVGAKAIGFQLQSWRTNSNRLNRGQQIDDEIQYQLYTVPTLPPVTALRPVNESESNDADRVQALIVTTKIRASNLAVDALLSHLDLVKEIYSENDDTLNQPDSLGIARHLLNVAYEEGTVNIPDVIQNLESKDVVDNIRAVLINRLREMAARLYMQSALSIARQFVLGSGCGKPLVLLGTDPYIANFLMLNGETRLLGDQFEFDIAVTMNERMRGLITMVFGEKTAYNSGTPCMLHWGNMLWRPETTLSMPIQRNGRISQELTVTPSLRHIHHMPMGGKLVINGIMEAMQKANEFKVQNTVTP